MKTRKWARGIITTFYYDEWDRELGRTYSDATPSVAISRDSFGRIISARAGNVESIYAYDSFGRVVQERQGQFELHRSWDSNSRLAEIRIDNSSEYVVYRYDDIGRNTGLETTGETFYFDYSSEGLSTIESTGGIYWEHSTDKDRKMTTYRFSFGASNLLDEVETLDFESRVVDRDISLNGLTNSHLSFEYNPKGELASVATLSSNCHFGYDGAGNRIFISTGAMNASYYSNSANQYDSFFDGTAHALTYDDDGNMLILPDGMNVEWDGENRIHSLSNGNRKLVFDYDYKGRMSTESEYGPTGELVVRRAFLWDGHSMLKEEEVSSNTTNELFYIWGPLESSANREKTMIKPLLRFDYNGNPRYSVFGMPNESVECIDGTGQVLGANLWTPYGTTKGIVGCPSLADAEMKYGYRSMRLVAGSNLFMAAYRAYLPSLGRWTSRDPLFYDVAFRRNEGNVKLPTINIRENNLYRFVQNDPINQIDPLGLATLTVSSSCCGKDLPGFYYKPEDSTNLVAVTMAGASSIDGLYLCGQGKVLKVPNNGWIRIECEKTPLGYRIIPYMDWSWGPAVWGRCKVLELIKGPGWCPGVYPRDDGTKLPPGWADCPDPYLPI